MTLADITDAQAVHRAVEEFDRLGRDRFLENYGFGRAYNYLLVIKGRLYDSKAIIGAAHAYQTGRPLRSTEFSGGQATVQRKLEELGFEVRVLDGGHAAGRTYWWTGLPDERSWLEV